MTIAAAVTAVILVYNRAADICRVVDCVLTQSVRPGRIIVVDNASPDGSGAAVAAAFPAVEVITLPENRGVGAGHNAGWAAALADPACAWVWVLEHDCFPTPDCLAELLAAHRRCLPAGEGFVLPAADNGQRRDDRPHLLMLHGRIRRMRPVAAEAEPRRHVFFTFNGLLLTAGLIRTVGALDEQFFMFCEDTDYYYRCLQNGCVGFRIPSARVQHIGLRDTARLDLRRFVVLLPGNESPPRIYYRFRNRLALAVRRRGRLSAAVRYGALYLMHVLYDLVAVKDKRGALVARTLALRDGLTGRLGRADYPFLRTLR